MRRGYVDTEVGQVHFRIAGVSGPAVILLHQTASSSRMFEPLMLALQDSFRLVAFDTPGFGQSDPYPAQPTIPDYVGALRQAASVLDFSQPHLIGHHTGAAIATQWAAEAPEEVRSLAMIGALAMGPEERARWLGGLSDAPIEASGEHFQRAWNRVAHIDAEPVVFPPRAEVRHREALDTLLAAPRWPEAYRAVFSHDFEHALSCVECRQILICGTEDILAPYVPATAALMRNGTVHTLDAGAYLLEQHLEEVIPVLREFLTDSSS